MMDAWVRDATPLATPKIYFDKHLKQEVVGSRQLALATGHRHSNIIAATRRVRQDRADMQAEFREWNDNPNPDGKKGRPRAVMTRAGLIATFARLRSLHRGVRMDAILTEYLDLFDAPKRHADPAPDSEIRPPPEPADLFKSVDTGPPSWQINAALALLRRTTLPREIQGQMTAWNTQRCDALRAAMSASGASWEQIGQIYGTEDPGAGK